MPGQLPLKDQMAQDSYILDLNPEASQFVPDLASVAKLDTNNPGAMLFLQGATLPIIAPEKCVPLVPYAKFDASLSRFIKLEIHSRREQKSCISPNRSIHKSNTRLQCTTTDRIHRRARSNRHRSTRNLNHAHHRHTYHALRPVCQKVFLPMLWQT